MRPRDIGEAEQRLLRDVAARISNRLEAEFTEPAAGAAAIGVTLRERGHSVTMEVPEALVAQGAADTASREALRLRIKAARDRMLFRRPPAPLPKKIAAAADPGSARGGFGFGSGRGRR